LHRGLSYRASPQRPAPPTQETACPAHCRISQTHRGAAVAGSGPRSTRHEPGLPQVLHEAHTIVAEQLKRLRDLAEGARREGELLSTTLRQVERQLDEALLQHRTAV